MTSSRKTYRHGDLRNALIERGLEALRVQSAADLSLRELAVAEGVSPRAPYQHFPTRNDYLRALVQAGFAQLTERFRQVGGGMDEIGHVYLAFAQERPNLFRLMFGGVECEPEPTFGEPFGMLLDSIRAIDPTMDERETVGAGLAAWALVHGLATLRLERLAPDSVLDSYTLEELGEMIARTTRPRPS
jgi:AcrR family transcriptional regulator